MTAEQQARDLLERMGVNNAQAFTAGDVVELANLIRDARQNRKREEDRDDADLIAWRKSMQEWAVSYEDWKRAQKAP